MLRILVLDHFYRQDITALRTGLTAADELFVVPATRFRQLAEKHFSSVAFSGVASPFNSSESSSWRSFTPSVERLTDWLADSYRPDLFVTPSDSFFYIRPVISRLRRRGIPTAVVQKETTISPDTMVEHSREIGQYLPFMSDVMTVCSERHKSFWVASGADPEQIHVTGQPRFDVYDENVDTFDEDHPVLLYLSYDDDAYLPASGSTSGMSWRPQRRATETVISEAARGQWQVVAKRHPQQLAQDDWLGTHAIYASSADDTRELIRRADVVVGFQTTALFEAALAGKPIIYAAWGSPFVDTSENLIPFHRYNGLVTHATSPEVLSSLLAEWRTLARPTRAAMEIVTEHLGPCDGRATQRVIAILRELGSQPRQDVVGVRRHTVRTARAQIKGRLAHLMPAARTAAPTRGALWDRLQYDWQIEYAEACRIQSRA